MTNNEVVKQYTNLVYKIAISKHQPHLFDDLLQEGFIALCRANRLFIAKKRNGRKKSAVFITYATVAVNRSMNAYIHNHIRKGLNVETLEDHHNLSNNPNLGKEAESVSEVKYLMKFVNKLPVRLIPIVVGLYGLDGTQKSRQEMSKELHISDTRLGQLLRKALRKLRDMLRGKYAKNYHNWKSTSKIFGKANNLCTRQTIRNKFKRNKTI